ncbi:MAG: aspartate aminotransferase family protein [Deltaproteobacteria bacterium]|nr:aspartate aminotransferase family protein [Deltaproteobacteria bacterium]
MRIPEKGASEEELFAAMQDFRSGDLPWRDGRVFGYTFDGGQEVEKVAKRAFTEFLSENALDPTVFPSLLRFENEIVSMAAHHLQGDADVVGNFSSGGTESIILAVKSARDHARATRPEVKHPKMLLPVTAHAAFHKAAHYLGVEVLPLPVDKQTFKADMKAAAELLDDDVILIVGSSPSYAHGVVDPIVELAAMAKARGVWMHVDACIGGFLLPYFRKLGHEVPDFDFSVDGVSSISMDLHKYAYCPKGASVVLYRNGDLRKHQLFATSRWTGYTIVNTTIQSSKSGGPLAAAWSVLRFLGEDGYLDLARRVKQTTDALTAGVEAIDGLRLLAQPEMSLISFVADDVNLFQLADLMRARGWYVQPQLSFEDYPANIHLSVDPGNHGFEKPFLAALADAVSEARAKPKADLPMLAEQVRTFFGSMPPEAVTEDVMAKMLGLAGISGEGLPGDMAEVNTVLDALPPAIRERLLTLFVNDLFVQPGD